jgi:hypothetical protein
VTKTKELTDERTKGPRDQRTKGPKDQGTKGPRDHERSLIRAYSGSLVLWSLGLWSLGLGSVGPLLAAEADRATVIIVAGAPGETEFAPDIAQQLAAWAGVSAQAGAKHVAIGGEAALGGSSDHDLFQQALEAEVKEGAGELWLVLVGHGTFDGKEAKLNLRGPDVSATEVAAWLKPFKRPVAIIDTTSASAPFLAKLAAPGRVVVTSTRSGFELNYARFGKFLAEALPDPKSDLDKDGQISLLEAFLSASHRTTEFYKTDGRLATEHALIDDNGDGLGTPSDWFRGVRATKQARDGAVLDGPRAHQFHLVRSRAEQQLAAGVRTRRDALELEIAKLRERKAKMSETAYLRELEQRLLEIAALYDGT